MKYMVKILEKERITLDREYVEDLEKKASAFEEILSFLEDKCFGNLMERTEKESNISLAKAKNSLSR